MNYIYYLRESKKKTEKDIFRQYIYLLFILLCIIYAVKLNSIDVALFLTAVFFYEGVVLFKLQEWLDITISTIEMPMGIIRSITDEKD